MRLTVTLTRVDKVLGEVPTTQDVRFIVTKHLLLKPLLSQYTPQMRLLLMPKWDQQCARRVAEYCKDLLPPMLREPPEAATRKHLRVAICQDCRVLRYSQNPTEAQYFVGLCRYLERMGIVVETLKVSFLDPPPYALEII